ncbi:MAG: zinc ribbon domain-containing protein, partial [Deltaproteobacteria bacterium]|nr:zinc ribbon domain-containing protein [Deltaproteobacteria bacterium]
MAKEENDDRFSRFGTVSFAAVTHVNDFVDYLEKGRLMGTKCKQCGRLFFPPRADCFHSLASDMEWFEVSGPGKLLTYSTLKYAPTGFSDELPYTIAVVEFQGFKV